MVDIRVFPNVRNRWTWDPLTGQFEQNLINLCHIRHIHPETKQIVNLKTEEETEDFIIIPDLLFRWRTVKILANGQREWDTVYSLIVDVRGPPHLREGRIDRDREIELRIKMRSDMEILVHVIEEIPLELELAFEKIAGKLYSISKRFDLGMATISLIGPLDGDRF